MTTVVMSRAIVRSGRTQRESLDVAAGFDRLCQVPGAAGLEAFLREVSGPSSPWSGPEFSITWGHGSPRARVFVQTRVEPGRIDLVADAAKGAFSRFCIPNASLASDLLQAIYGESADGQRLGLGVECNPSGVLGLRLYLDLFSRGKDKAVRLRREVLLRLNANAAFEVAARAAATGHELPACRILGVDFPRAGEPGLKAYLPARRLPHGAVARAAGVAARDLARVLESLGGDQDPLERSSTLCAIGFRAQQAAAQAGCKLDFQLADFAKDDGDAQRKVELVLDKLALDPGPYRAALDIALEGSQASDSQGIQQYLGVHYDRARGWRSAVYFRPVSSGHTGVSRRARPRSSQTRPGRAAIDRGIKALLRMFGDGPLWRDFNCSIGPSDEWVTAYVVARLRELPEASAELGQVATQLARRQRPDGGWGYNASVTSDCDSTAWALLALNPDELPGAARDRATAFLLQHHDGEGGGFRTYRQSLRPKRAGLRAEWFEPQPCVTALAVSALLRCGADSTGPAVRSAGQFLQAVPPKSCWWPDESYVSAAVTTALLDVGLSPPAFDLPQSSASAFCLANTLGLAVMLERPERDDLAERLIDLQSEDGSWLSVPILRIPDDKPGIVTISSGQNGCFTTATAVWALSRWRDRRKVQ